MSSAKHTAATRRALARIWLQDIVIRASEFADELDPKRRRNYERDPLLRALDAVATAANRGVYAEDAKAKGGAQ